jgi:ribosomal protein S18 acetylase RimI-like enzyme
MRIYHLDAPAHALLRALHVLQELIGAASITPFSCYPSLLTAATHGLLFGRQWPTISCLLRALQTSDSPAVAAQHKTLGITAELSFLGVLPEYQRRGTGRKLLQEILAAWDMRQGGPLILYTTQPKALRLYQSQGFEVLLVREVGGGQLTVWYMHRPQHKP